MAWFAALAPALTAASTVVAVGSTIQAGKAASDAAEYNAKLSEQEAKAANDQAAREEEALRRQNVGFLGKQRAALAEAGLGYGGTTGLLADQSAVLAELDALNIRYAGQNRGQGLLSQAAASRFSGKQAKTSSYSMAGSQLLAGGSKTYKDYKLSQG